MRPLITLPATIPFSRYLVPRFLQGMGAPRSNSDSPTAAGSPSGRARRFSALSVLQGAPISPASPSTAEPENLRAYRGGNPRRSHFVGMISRVQLAHALQHRVHHASMRDAHRATIRDEADPEKYAELRNDLSERNLLAEGFSTDLMGLSLDSRSYSSIIDLCP